jgi:hypothetical protein
MQSIGTGLVDVQPSDYFELIARQTSGSTKNVAAHELTWFTIEVVESERRPKLASNVGSPGSETKP